MGVIPANYDLSGLFDLHIHTQPDIQPRLLDDLEAAQQAKAAGMQAILIKSHVTSTAGRASIAEKAIGGIKVFGGLALNEQVGGFNPTAVEAAIRMGAKVIWMPTRSAMSMYRRAGKQGGLSIFQPDRSLLPAVMEIVELIRQAHIALATGHLTIEETIALVGFARSLKLPKIMITHPESELVQMPVNVQKSLAGPGVFFERCYVDTTPLFQATTCAKISQHIREVGVESTVLATDLGQVGNPSPVNGMMDYLSSLSENCITGDEIQRMTRENPAFLLDL